METIRNSITTLARIRQFSWQGYADRTDETPRDHLWALVEETARVLRREGYRITSEAIESAYCRMEEIHASSPVVHIEAITLAVRNHLLRGLF